MSPKSTFALLVTLALMAPVSSSMAAEIQFLRGDANLDEVIDISDSMSTLKFLFGGENKVQPDCLAAADFNGDGNVDISDAVSSLNFLFRGGVEPAAPYPEPDYDPMADGPGCYVEDVEPLPESELETLKDIEPVVEPEPEPEPAPQPKPRKPIPFPPPGVHVFPGGIFGIPGLPGINPFPNWPGIFNPGFGNPLYMAV